MAQETLRPPGPTYTIPSQPPSTPSTHHRPQTDHQQLRDHLPRNPPTQPQPQHDTDQPRSYKNTRHRSQDTKHQDKSPMEHPIRRSHPNPYAYEPDSQQRTRDPYRAARPQSAQRIAPHAPGPEHPNDQPNDQQRNRADTPGPAARENCATDALPRHPPQLSSPQI